MTLNREPSLTKAFGSTRTRGQVARAARGQVPGEADTGGSVVSGAPRERGAHVPQRDLLNNKTRRGMSQSGCDTRPGAPTPASLGTMALGQTPSRHRVRAALRIRTQHLLATDPGPARGRAGGSGGGGPPRRRYIPGTLQRSQPRGHRAVLTGARSNRNKGNVPTSRSPRTGRLPLTRPDPRASRLLPTAAPWGPGRWGGPRGARPWD